MVGSFNAFCLHDPGIMSDKNSKAFFLSLSANENLPRVSGISDFLRVQLGFNPEVCVSLILDKLGRI